MDATFERRKIAHFVLTGVLGAGGMGTVYRAEDERLRRTVAVKLLPATLTDDTERRARFLREARAAAAVVHSNIASVFEIGEWGDEVFIAMEHVRGQSLRKLLASGPLEAPRAVHLAIEIARGVAAAHDAGVVHRDLKPENVMVGDDDDVKVLDFGLARVEADARDGARGEGETELHLTAQGRILGTPGYMSPEQSLGRAVDRRTDVFALGVILYEMLSGRRPFRGDTPMALIVSVSSEPPVPLASVLADVPEELERIVDRCIEKLPERRYPDARALLTDLRALGSVAALPLATSGVGSTRSQTTPSPTNERASGPKSATSWPSRPTTTSAAAASAYLGAMQTWRTSSATLARNQLEAAIELDPSLAAAHLRLALILVAPRSQGELTPAPSRAREHFKRAERERETLEPREHALLEATRPMFDVTTNVDEVVRRLEEACLRFQGDREILYWRGVAALLQQDAALVDTFCDRLFQLDPDFGPAYALRVAAAYELRADLDAARRIAAEGVARLPSAGHCLGRLVQFLALDGDVDGVERTARQWISVDPEHPVPYWCLAQALDRGGAPVESVAEALRQSGERHAPGEREEIILGDQVELAFGHGDFDRGIELSLELEARVYERRSDALPRIENTINRAAALIESGRMTEGADLLEALERRRAAWSPHPAPVAGGLGYDPSLEIAFMLHTAGRMPVERLDKTRARWLERQARMRPPPTAGYVWMRGWAEPARTVDEARAALAALPPHLPLSPSLSVDVLGQAAIGRVHALVGNDAEAFAALALPARVVWRSVATLKLVPACLIRGQVAERLGDASEARASYGAVLEHWGDAKPRSITADAAREALRRLDGGALAAPSPSSR